MMNDLAFRLNCSLISIPNVFIKRIDIYIFSKKVCENDAYTYYLLQPPMWMELFEFPQYGMHVSKLYLLFIIYYLLFNYLIKLSIFFLISN